MKALTFMLIAGDPSGDMLAAELVTELRQQAIARSQDTTADVQPLRTALAPRFFGAGGPKMAAAGVELAFDLTQHSVIGFAEVLKSLGKFKRLFKQLLQVAIEKQPDVIIGVDYGGFNLRFGKAIKDYVRQHRSEFTPWNPKVVQFVSPQVWASRAGRAQTLAENHDLLLSIFPFEKEWYARRVPRLRVEFVGHPMMGRSQMPKVKSQKSEISNVMLLPGSRRDEIRRHLPLLVEVARTIQADTKARFFMVLPNEELAAEAQGLAQVRVFRELSEVQFDFNKHPFISCVVGNLSQALATADLAIAKSGTVTMECALHGVPAVVFYKTSWPTYAIGKQIITVKYIAMPNLLASEEIYPEFIQHAATPENIGRAGLELLRDKTRRADVQAKLAKVIATLGGPGAPRRAAAAILRLLP